VTSKDWNELYKQSQSNDDSKICEKLAEQIGLQKPNAISETKDGVETVYKKTSKAPVCKKMCFEEKYDDTTENILENIRPICKFISFGYQEISKVPAAQPSAAVPVENVKKSEAQPVPANQGNYF
jgi:hypothetical protein